MAITRYKSKLRCTESAGKYGEKEYNWKDFLQKFSTTNGALTSVAFGTGAASSTKLALNSSNLGALMFASTDVLNFLMKVPTNCKVNEVSYLDIYTMAGADSLATKGERIGITATYCAVTPIASGTSAGTGLSATFSSSGLTQPTSRVIHTGQVSGRVFKDSVTIAASTLTADNMVNWKLLMGLTGTEGDYGIQKAVYRYVRDWI